MRTSIKEVRGYVNRFLEEIRLGTGIEIEDIVVRALTRQDKFDSGTFMRTTRGLLEVNLRNDYDDIFNLPEITVLHELGHRAGDVINPSINDKFLDKFILDDVYDDPASLRRVLLEPKPLPQLKRFNEGIAECFGLDIYPNFCSLSNDGKLCAERRRTYHLESSTNPSASDRVLGYNLFHAIHSKYGMAGVIRYVKSLWRPQMPTEQDMRTPSTYVDSPSLS